MFSETHKATLAAVLPGFLLLGCTTWRPVAPDPETFDALHREVAVETWDRGSYTMVATDVHGDDLLGKDVEWRYTVADSAAFHELIGVGRSLGPHEERLDSVSIPFSSILTIEARKPDPGKSVGLTLLVLASAAAVGFGALVIALATSDGWY